MDWKMDFLSRLASGLAKQFGSNCEIVIHDLAEGTRESSIIVIENGHVSNRKVGDGPSSVVLETLAKDPSEVEDQLCYLTEVDGKMLKSSTIYIRDDEGKITGIMGINYDISRMVMFQNELNDILMVDSSSSKESRHIPHDVNSLLDDLIERAVKEVGSPVAYMSREDKIRAIKYLDSHGAFLITKSGDKISSYFGISKYTMYSYLDKDKDKERE
jgi:predicted transcriptional regulator YheO